MQEHSPGALIFPYRVIGLWDDIVIVMRKEYRFRVRTSGLPAPTGLELILHWYQLVQTSRAVQPIAFGHGHIKISGFGF